MFEYTLLDLLLLEPDHHFFVSLRISGLALFDKKSLLSLGPLYINELFFR